MVADDPLKVDLKPIAAEVKTGLTRLKKAWRRAIRTFSAARPFLPEGACSFTIVADMLANGDTVEAIHAAYP